MVRNLDIVVLGVIAFLTLLPQRCRPSNQLSRIFSSKKLKLRIEKLSRHIPMQQNFWKKARKIRKRKPRSIGKTLPGSRKNRF